jgi:hypothetical protein
MVGVSTASWLVLSVALGSEFTWEFLLGMAGPLAVASASWVLMERTYRQDPIRLTPLMIKAFAVAMVFFAAYVAIVVTTLTRRPVPFVASFTSYFIALHLAQAVCLRRLFAGHASAH